MVALPASHGIAEFNPEHLPIALSVLARRKLPEIKKSPSAYRDFLCIDADGETIRFSDAIDPWQLEDHKAMEPAWMNLCGLPTGDGPIIQRAYFERPRGHSKTTDLATMVTWALIASPRKITGVAAAASKDQARLLRDGIDTLLRLNPWISEFLIVNNYTVYNQVTGSKFNILAADAAKAYGQTPDFVIFDELTHCAKRDLWDSLFSAAAKRKKCVFIVIANAGFGKPRDADPKKGSWQWQTREACRMDERWYFHRLEGPQASWLNQEDLLEQRRLLPETTYQRVWLNQWLSGDASGIDMEAVHQCITLSQPIAIPSPEWFYIGGLDLGLRRDHAGFVVVGGHIPSRRFALAHVKSWNPKDYESGEIRLKDIEDHVALTAQRLGILGIAYDPWQCASTSQQLTAREVRMFEYPFTPKHCAAMATAVTEIFANRSIDLYDDDELIGDLGRLQIIDRIGGLKLDAPRDDSGHCDVATAFCITLPWVKGTMDDYAPV